MKKDKDPNSVFVMVEQEVTLKQIASLLCTGMEGGIGYWAQIVKYKKPPKLEFTMEKLGGDEKPEVFPHIDYPLNEGGAVILQDLEENKRYTLTRKKLRRGIQIMAEKYPRHFADFINENDDAITGDVFIQCCVLGDVIYG